MNKKFIHKVSNEIDNYHKTREAYKKQFLLRSQNFNHEQRKMINKLFMKIDRLRNHVKLWLKHLVSKKPANYDSYVQLIDRGRAEINKSFKQLDQALYQA